MNFNIKNCKIRIEQNDYNKRYWNPIGQFTNLTSVRINETWFKCSLRFTKKGNKYFVQICNPFITEPNSNRIIEFRNRGIYKELEVSRFKFNLLKFLKNEHPLKDWEYKTRVKIFQRKNTLFAFLIAFLFASIYYLVNHYSNNSLMNFIAENNWIQTIIIFLTISSFINIFHPFTIRKELNEKNVETISKETFERTEKEKEELERIKKRASF